MKKLTRPRSARFRRRTADPRVIDELALIVERRQLDPSRGPIGT